MKHYMTKTPGGGGKMDEDKKGYIRYLYNKRKMNISKIASELSMSRPTVRKALFPKGQAGESIKSKAKTSKLDPYKEEIKNIFSENPRISNVVILEKINRGGYQGKRSILGDYLASLRRKDKGAFINIETLPAEQAQADWAYCGQILCGKYKRKLYMFCMVLSYSRQMYIEFTVSMSLSQFLACHINAFNFFEGITKDILYDNLKSVVKARYGREISFNGKFLDFADYYGFNPKVCNVRAANEKGKVERAIQYIKNNFLSKYILDYPGGSFSHIKAQSVIWLNKTANQRLHSSTHKIPRESFLLEEKKYLSRLPDNPYDYADVVPKPASKDCLVTFETNRYSVPSDYAGRLLTLKAYGAEIKIFNNKSEEIASHKRCYDKYCLIKQAAHYASLIEKRKKAAHHNRQDKFITLCPEAGEYLKGLLEATSNPDFHIEKILELSSIYGKTAAAGTIARANEYKAYGWEYIKNILLQVNPVVPSPVNLTLDKNLLDIDIQSHDLSLYDNLSEKDIENLDVSRTDKNEQ